MNTPIVSTEAKARLQEAVVNYVQPAPHKFRALEQVKECIAGLRGKRASYKTITALLRDTAGIDVSHQTVARYCREVLETKPTRKPAKKSGGSPRDKSAPAASVTQPASAGRTSPVQPELHSPSPASPATVTSHAATPSSSESPYERSRGPRIAHIRLATGKTT